ncbi:hypothetical protein EYF80_052983 [Liparis tanakae]|uniref:Uncharacterized protein n=1 Tax=Liparis tanakae TaxID=230148 RepID=A0A4Z2F7L5_9TELE|nr:hypothetical protein EYF80_052983 [Liparis tanakae]
MGLPYQRVKLETRCTTRSFSPSVDLCDRAKSHQFAEARGRLYAECCDNNSISRSPVRKWAIRHLL